MRGGKAPDGRWKGSHGFTLIELMIVVAIIGILAAVAIPNFMTYQAKARQSEAKVALGGIFTAATAYFASNNTYLATTFSTLGYARTGAGKHYLFWESDSIAGSSSGCTNNSSAPTGVTATATAFTAGARGNIDGDLTCDDWTIDDGRVLSNISDDVLN